MVPCLRHKLKSADELWNQDHIEETLVTIPTNRPRSSAALFRKDWINSTWIGSAASKSAPCHWPRPTWRKDTAWPSPFGSENRLQIPSADIAADRLSPRALLAALWQGFQTPVLSHFLKVVQAAAAKVALKL